MQIALAESQREVSFCLKKKINYKENFLIGWRWRTSTSKWWSKT
jgi:hypothetical protein